MEFGYRRPWFLRCLLTPIVYTPLVVVGMLFTITSRAREAADFSFTDAAKAAGLNQFTVYGGTRTNRYLLETTGCGVAVLDVDGDVWLDVFLVNGTTLQGFSTATAPICHLYRNRRDGTFEDVTARAGVGQSGWGQGACAADYDNDGHDDLFVTSWGQNHLYHNRGDGTFEDVTTRAGLRSTSRRWGAGCAFVDYDRDGKLDLFAANYIDFDLADAPVPESGLCRYKGVPVACGPPGLRGGKNVLYHNNGNGTFADVSSKSGISAAAGTYGLGVSTLDFDDDGWTDLYVANDSNPSTLYRNNHDGTFSDIAVIAGCAYSQDGKPQAGMNETPSLLRNDYSGASHWIELQLEGTSSNRMAIGALITLTVNGHSSIRTIVSQSSYYSHDDARVHFGLGGSKTAESIVIRWPAGTVQSLTDIAGDRIVKVREPLSRK